MTVKLALCTRFNCLPAMFFDPGFKENLCVPIDPTVFNAPVELVDRAVCETDPGCQQFIPYIVVQDILGRTFTYCRGKGSAEARLAGNLSIGLGGHVDGVPPQGTSLLNWFTQEARRELFEEVGLSLDAVVALEFTHMIKDATNPVGQVHFGLLATVTVNPRDLTLLEKDVVEDSFWFSLEELQRPKTFERLENWSKAVVLQKVEASKEIIYHPV